MSIDLLSSAAHEMRGHCLTLYYSNRWGCCRRSNINPSAHEKLFVEVQNHAMPRLMTPVE